MMVAMKPPRVYVCISVAFLCSPTNPKPGPRYSGAKKPRFVTLDANLRRFRRRGKTGKRKGQNRIVMRGVGGGGGILEEEGEKGRKQAGVKPLEHRRVWPSIF